MQEAAAGQIQATGAAARRHHKRAVTGQPPFRPYFRPVQRPPLQFGIQHIGLVEVALMRQPQRPRTFTLRQHRGIAQPLRRHFRYFTEAVNVIGGGVMQRRHKPGTRGNHPATHCQPGTDRFVIQQLCQHLYVHGAGLATAGATIQPSGMRVVGGMAAMSDQQDLAGQTADAHGIENPSGQIGFLLQRQRQIVFPQRPLSGTGQIVDRMRLGGQPEGFAQQLGRIAQSGRFHHAECRGRTAAEFRPGGPLLLLPLTAESEGLRSRAVFRHADRRRQ